MGCQGVNNQACGGEFIIAVYQFNPLIAIECPDPIPAPFDVPFHLNAVFVDEPTTSVPITMTSAIFHTNDGGTTAAEAGILSVGIMSSS